jgi:muconolactone D-isomerase
MLFYIQMRWNVEGRLTNEDLWALETKEGDAKAAVEMGLVKSIYKVAGQRRVIAIVDLPDAESLDRTIMAGLPMAEYLEFEAIWPLREYGPFMNGSLMPKSVSAPPSAPPAAPKAAPRSGLRKSTPISNPQKLPDTAPDAVVLTIWCNWIWPSGDLVAMTASPSLIRYSFCSSNRRVRTSSAFSRVG